MRRFCGESWGFDMSNLSVLISLDSNCFLNVLNHPGVFWMACRCKAVGESSVTSRYRCHTFWINPRYISKPHYISLWGDLTVGISFLLLLRCWIDLSTLQVGNKPSESLNKHWLLSCCGAFTRPPAEEEVWETSALRTEERISSAETGPR